MKNERMVPCNARLLASMKSDVAIKSKAKGFTISDVMRRTIARIANREVDLPQKQEQEREVQVAFRVPGDDLDRALAYAKECGISLREFMELAIRNDPQLQ